MTTGFRQLNIGWNADPNAPEPRILVDGADLLLEFRPNVHRFPEYASVSRIVLTFHRCWRYRLGTVNDEGWYRGECRFSGIAPAWGEFYEVTGHMMTDRLHDWIILSEARTDTRHFLFYFRDEEFECDAESWTKRDVA